MSQKIPLFGGVPFPIPAGAPDTTIDPLFTPPDVGVVPNNAVSYYELYLWWTQGVASGGTGDFRLSARPTGSPIADEKGIYYTKQQVAPLLGRPIQTLRGYPMRGDISLSAVIETPALPQALFGYYRRVGGAEESRERRFIGENTGGFTAGTPLELVAGEKKVFHTFAQNRIDNVSLALMTPQGAAQLVNITFEDSANNVLAEWEQTVLSADPTSAPPGLLDPYSFRDVPFGGGQGSALDHISIEANAGNTAPVWAYGDFWRG